MYMPRSVNPRHLNSCNMVLWILFEPYNAETHVCISFSDQVGLMSVGHVLFYHIFLRELVLKPQLDQKKVSAPGFLQCRAQSESKGPFSLNLSA